MPVARRSGDAKVLATIDKPFQATGGLKMLKGNLGTGVIKILGRKGRNGM